MAIKMMKLSTFLLVLIISACSSALTPADAKAAAPPNASAAYGPRANNYDDPADGVHVSPSGNDAVANGSESAPYKSVNAALEAANPGQTIILHDGVYREGMNVRIRKPDITVKSKKGERAVIDLTNYDPGCDEDSGVYFDVDSSGGRLQSVEVIGGFYAVCMETMWDWGDDSNRSGASNIVIEDCVLHDSRYDVVKIKPNCDNITIRYNEIYNSGRAFDGNAKNGEDNAEGIDNVNGDNMRVHNNHIHDICSNAVYAKGGAADALIESNFIERAYGAGIMVGFDTSPEYFDLAANPKYYENVRGVVRNNLIVGTGWEGIGLYGAKDAVIQNNTLVNVANGGQYHAAIYFGLTYQDWESYAGRPASVNPGIHHNIICQPSGIVRPMIEIRYANELGGMSALDGSPVMSDNCYYIAGKSAAFTDLRPGSKLENAGLSAWQAHIGGDSGSIEADPVLGADYVPANPQCAGMGVASGFSASAPMSNFRKARAYTPGQFADVNENAWYGYNREKSAATAYEYGLMQGSSAAAFNPDGNITIAEAIAVAARVRSIYNGGAGEFAQGGVWYQAYVNYAIAGGIINADDFPDYSKAATRAEMAYIFSRALPEEEFMPQNTVKSLPDVNSGTVYSAAVFMLYRAGVLAGNDDRGTFNPGAGVTRAEAAAVITRVILPDTRTSGKTFGR